MTIRYLLNTAIVTLFCVTVANANPMIKNSGPEKPLDGQAEWLQHRDFFVPFGTGGLEPSRGYPKPYIPRRANGFDCGEAEGMLRGLGYRNIKAVDCTSPILRLQGSRIGSPYLLHIDTQTGNIIGRDRL